MSLAALPSLLSARSLTPPPPARTGAAVDGGLSCTACHRVGGGGGEANSDPRGRIRIETPAYKPGVQQTIRVIVEHPEAQKWGFQLTARVASNDGTTAGRFTASPAVAVTPMGDLEFASHSPASVQTGQRNMGMWEVMWTPPATDVGEVVFYFAGNATDGSANNQGDYVYTGSARIRAEAPCNLTTTPAVTIVRNGASFRDFGFAINTMISVGGTGFQPPGQSRNVSGSDIVNNKFPTQLGCVAVEVAGQLAPVAYVDASQINAQIPSISQLGDVPLRVVLNPGTPNERKSAPFNIKLDSWAPAWFRFLPSPCIAATFPNGQPAADPVLVPGVNARKPRVGEIVAMYATGLGVTEPFFQAGEISSGLARVRDAVSIDFNGTTMRPEDVLFVGLSPGSISGLYQINIRVPANARPGADNPVTIRMGSATSQGSVFLPVE
jgi:uncharacterized protein (TIGR03437 family)